jgi:hyperosmotically inducible protein
MTVPESSYLQPKNVVLFLLITVLSSASVLAIASQPPQQKPRESLGTSGPASERIAREVRHELLMLPYYTLFDILKYKVDGNKVTLYGKVTRPTLKSDAEKAVKKIEGVESVDNQIEVLPPLPDDDRIRLAEYRAIYGFPALNRYAMGVLPPIHIIVDHGRVTLEGTVDSEADKNIAEIQAKSVPGVFSVTNNLVVTGSSAK